MRPEYFLSKCESMPISMVLPVETLRWVWVVMDSLGRYHGSCFLLVREGFDLAVLQLKKLSQNIDTEPESVLKFCPESEL